MITPTEARKLVRVHKADVEAKRRREAEMEQARIAAENERQAEILRKELDTYKEKEFYTDLAVISESIKLRASIGYTEASMSYTNWTRYPKGFNGARCRLLADALRQYKFTVVVFEQPIDGNVDIIVRW
jgi:hypothetical protein